MNTRLLTLIFIGLAAASSSFCQNKTNPAEASQENMTKEYEVEKSENEWKQLLSPDAFSVLREKGTEYAFMGKYNDFKEKGIYRCAGCGNQLFESKTKYNSGSGWPSFYKPIDENAIEIEIDNSFGMPRDEILCAKCGGHLGHMFNDGPKPTGLRYCVNSISLDFQKK
jgi:peptide-methionine (R)-S-oxide reductase